MREEQLRLQVVKWLASVSDPLLVEDLIDELKGL